MNFSWKPKKPSSTKISTETWFNDNSNKKAFNVNKVC